MITPPTEPNPGDRISASWMRGLVRYVRAITPVSGPGVKASQTPNGTILTASSKAGRSAVQEVALAPFAVRYVVQGSSDASGTVPYTGYEIYLPEGCVSVGEDCLPLNPPARRTSGGSTVDVTGWYRFAAPQLASGETVFNVRIHAKTSAARTGVDAFADWPKRLLWVDARRLSPSQAELAADVGTVGDAFATVVAVVTVGETPSVRQTLSTPIAMTDAANREFELLWCFSVSGLSLVLDRIYVRNLNFAAGALPFSAPSLVEIDKTHEAVYLKLNTQADPYVGSIVSYASGQGSGSSMTVSQQVRDEAGEYNVMVSLYSLSSGHVTGDFRQSAFAGLQVYRM